MKHERVLLGAQDIEAAALALAQSVANTIDVVAGVRGATGDRNRVWSIFGIPRGGIPAAALFAARLQEFGFRTMLTDRCDRADIIVDDIYDTGETMKRFRAINPTAMLAVLYARETKNHTPAGMEVHAGCFKEGWLVFPWERDGANDESATDIVTRLLCFIGEDPARGGLVETPRRVLKAWEFWTSGYQREPGQVLKVFEDGAERVDEMVAVCRIPLYSHCEHHLAPFFGVAHVAYIPNGKIVGLSKLSRLVDIFARRLQVQERLTNQIADALDEHLKPKGVGVMIECRHMCMESRGVCQQGHATRTSALRGVIKTDAAARAEFLRVVGAPINV